MKSLISFLYFIIYGKRRRWLRNEQLRQREIETTDRMIDALVYELNGLTEEEIAIVEE